MGPYVTYTPHATSSKEETVNIIMFTQFKYGNLLSETRNNAESSDKYDDDSIMPPLIIKEEMDGMDSRDKYMSTEVLENIRDGSQSHMSVNIIEARYKKN